MFEKVIETKFEDQHAGQAEFEKHRAEAAAALGANPLIVSCSSEGVSITDDEGRDTGAFLCRLTTRWKQRDPADVHSGNQAG